MRVDSEHVIETLMDHKEFSVAHAYAKVVGTASDQISVKEVTSYMSLVSTAVYLSCVMCC